MPTDIQEQIERRRERARAEILKIANKGNHPVFSIFEVSSVSKTTTQKTKSIPARLSVF